MGSRAALRVARARGREHHRQPLRQRRNGGQGGVPPPARARAVGKNRLRLCLCGRGGRGVHNGHGVCGARYDLRKRRNPRRKRAVRRRVGCFRDRRGKARLRAPPHQHLLRKFGRERVRNHPVLRLQGHRGAHPQNRPPPVRAAGGGRARQARGAHSLHAVGGAEKAPFAYERKERRPRHLGRAGQRARAVGHRPRV